MRKRISLAQDFKDSLWNIIGYEKRGTCLVKIPYSNCRNCGIHLSTDEQQAYKELCEGCVS